MVRNYELIGLNENMIDRTGEKYNYLTVIGLSQNKSTKSLIWTCQCECGNIVDVYETSLIKGYQRSCGCKSRKRKDWVGKRIGNITVLEKTDERYRQYIIWKCKCDCGKEVLISTNTLEKYRTLDCGCGLSGRIKRKKNTDEDRTGEVFYHLTVLGLAKIGTNHGLIWRCQCECGNIIEVGDSYLVQGFQRSCGCKSRVKKKGEMAKIAETIDTYNNIVSVQQL